MGETGLDGWLSESNPIDLGGGLALVGDDGWGDGRLGDASGSSILLNDFRYIEELTGLSREDRIGAVNALGHASAARLAPKLEQAAARCSRVCVVTHVPPFAEATWHEGRSEVAPNVVVHTAPATYGAPAIAGILVDDGTRLRVEQD